MPKENIIEKTIPKLYRRKYEDLGMLFFVEGQLTVIQTITVKQALYNYFKFINADNFDIKCAEVTLSRMRAEFIDLKYTNAKS
jgi:hypothetical protein